MSWCILITLAIYLFGCTHVKTVSPSSIRSEIPQPILCSEADGQSAKLRLSIDLTSTGLKKRSIHKQFEVSYVKKNGPPYLGISREILEWRSDRIVIAEIALTETQDRFILNVTSFERAKQVMLTSNYSLFLRLCEEAEMSISGGKELRNLKAKVELVGQPCKTAH